MKRFDEKEKRSLARIGFFLILVAIGIAAVGNFSYQAYAARLRTQVDEQIISINKLKANELTEQFGGYLADAEILHRNSDFAVHVHDYFKTPQDDKLKKKIQTWLQGYQPNGEYENVILLDPKGTAYISANGSMPLTSSEVKAHISKAVSSKQVEFVDYYKDETGQSSRLAVLIPITDPQSGSQIAGLVLMVINPNVYLYPYIQQWPVPSDSGETMLVRREGDEILLLNTLRLGSYAPLTLRIDLTDVNAAAMKAAIEGNHSTTGMDYRGESVVAVAHVVPNSPWILITKVDTAEAYAPIKTYLRQTIIVCISLISIVGVALAIIWRSQRLRYYHRQFELAKALSQSELNFRSFFNTIDHMLFVLDSQGDILLANDTVSRILGYSTEEIKGKNVLMLHPPERREEAGRIIAEMLAGTADYCPVPLCAKDGQYIPVETRVVKGQWSGQDVVFGVTKDISEIRASEEKFSKVFQSSPSPMALTDTKTGRYIDVNEIFLQTLGFTREDVIGKTAGELSLFVDAEQRMALLERLKVQGYLRNEDVLVRAKSGELHNGVFSAEYIKLQHQDLLLTVMNDITERRLDKEALRNASQRQENIIESMHIGTWEWNIQTGETVFNDRWAQITGYTLAELEPISIKIWQALAHPDDMKRSDELLEQHFTGKLPYYDYECRMKHKDGHWVWVHDRGRVVTRTNDGKPLTMFGTHADITERKLAEAELNSTKNRLLEAQQLSHLGNWEWDLQKQALFWSDEVYRIFGVKPGEFTPSVDVFENAIHPEDRENFLRQRVEMLAEKQSSSIDHRIILPDGQIRHVQERTQLTLDQNGNASRAIGTVQDITERKQIEEALRRSETLLSEAQQIGHIGHWEWTAPSRNLNVSDEVLRIFEMPLHEGRIISQEIIGAMMLKEDFENIRKLDHATFSNHTSDMDYEFRINLPGGKARWIHQKAKIEYGEAGQPVRMMGTIQDVTARKLAEDALRASEEKYRIITEYVDDIVWQVDTNLKFTYASPAAERVLGYTSSEVESFHIYDLLDGTDVIRLRDNIEARIEQKLAPGKLSEYKMKRKDGSWVDTEVLSSPIFDVKGQFAGLVGVARNISERKLIEMQLQDAETKYRTLVEQTPAIVYTDEIGGNWQYLNPQIEKVLGFPADAFLQDRQAFKDLIHPDDLERFQMEVDECVSHGGRINMEYRMTTRDGKQIWIRDEANTTTDQVSGKTILKGVLYDITDRKMAEEALQASESNYRKLVETSESAISVLDKDGKILYANSRANQRWDAANHVGKSLFDIYPHEFAEQYLVDIQEVIRTQTGITAEEPDQIKDRQMWFRINIQPIQNADGSSDSVMVSTLDITEKVESETLLKESETRFRQLADNIQEVFWMYDRKSNKHIYSNPAYEFIYGIRAEDISIQSLVDITLPEDQPILLAALEKQNNGEATEAEYRIRHKDDSIHWIWDRSFPIYDEAGKLARTAGVATDITENKKTEDDLRERESFLQSIVNSAPGIIVSYNLEGYLQYANQFLPKQSDAAFHNMKFLDLLHPDHVPPVLDAFQKAVTTWEPQRLELLSLTQNDGYHWFDVTYSPQIINGEVKGLTSFAYDINERKQAEAALQKSEAVYRQAIEVSGAVPYLQAYTNIGEGIDYSFIGEGIRQITGYGPEEFNGKLWDSLVEEMVLLDELAGYSIHEAIQRVRSGKNSIWKCEHRIRARNGETRWVFEAAVELRDPNGVSHGSIGLYQDITERKIAEEQLRQSEERFRTLYETMLDGVVYQNRNGEIISTNSSAERIMGLSFDQMRGLTSTDPRWRSLHEDGSPFPGEEHPAMVSLRTGLPVRDTVMGVYDPKYNSTTWININAVPQFLPGETEPFQVYTTFRDITLQKQDEIITRKRLELIDYAIGHSFSDLIQKAMDQICELFQSPIGFLHELINNGSETRLLAWSPNTLNEFYQLEGEHGMRYPLGNAGLWAEAVRTGKAIIHNDYPSEPNKKGIPDKHPPLTREMVVPIHRNNRVAGIIGVGNKGSEYSQTDLEIAVRFSDFIWDIVERKQTELALRDSEEKYRGLMESLDSVVATADFEGRFLYMNDMAADQLGGKPRDFIGKTMHELFPLPIADAQLKTIQQAFHEDKGMVSETMSMVQNNPRWYRTMVQPIHNENGEVVYALINSTDIHDLKTAQHDLQELNRTLEERVEQRTAEVQDLYDNAPNGYHSLDADGAFILINQTELNRLGYSRREILGAKKFRDLLTPQSQKLFDEIFPDFKVNGSIADLTLELIRKDGSIFPVLLNASVMRDEYGKFLMSRSTTIDITERVKVENALRESRDELSSANASLEKAAHMKDEFLASMSHELRTPLTGVLGLSEALQLKAYGDLNDKQLKTLKTIEDSGRHLLDLINDILDLSKIEAGRLELQMAPTYMSDICQASLQLIKGMAQQKHQQVRYTPAAEVVLGYADARRIKQILVNLLSNAVKFTPDGGEIGLDVESITSEKKLRFSVWDKGIGIKPEDMHKLFKPFTQIDSSLAREYNGTGLGLSLAHRLVELHNGGIEVESVPGEGSRFTVTLPWSPQEAQSGGQTAVPRRRQSDFVEPKKSTSATILVADDNETVLNLLSDFLETKQYHVVKVRSGAELITKVTEILPDLMLVDIQMPGMDGLETIRRIRAHTNAAIASTPIIAVTALAMPGDRELCMRAGANDYMSKPLRLLELAEIIEKWKRTP